MMMPKATCQPLVAVHKPEAEKVTEMGIVEPPELLTPEPDWGLGQDLQNGHKPGSQRKEAGLSLVHLPSTD